jgi:3' terminal RNA ribose 2'-O-methyltransferase Hen1
MLLSITTTHQPATDLGFLLHKAPHHLQSFELTFGQAHVFYPEASEESCTACLLVDVDPVGLSRRERGAAGVSYAYVNDRPYATSSLMSTAISRVLGTAMGGRCAKLPELAATAIPLVVRMPALSCRGGESMLRGFFEPLGYEVEATSIPLAPAFPEWGASRYFDVTLRATCRLAELLTHLYVLLPALDGDKHYWFGADEVDKLMAKGAGWLEGHPQRTAITARYLGRRHRYVSQALERLLDIDRATADPEAAIEAEEQQPAIEPERREGLNDQRLGAVMAVLKASGAKRVLDLGCGEGHLLQRIAHEPQFEDALGIDVSSRQLADANRTLARVPERLRQHIRIEQGSLLYRDDRLRGWDAAALVEVIEHIDLDRLPVFEANLFGAAQPRTVVVTTPNRDYHAKFEGLAEGATRHGDHRFEWSREEFAAWASDVASKYGYEVRLLRIGPVSDDAGPPTQMAVFER